MEDEFRILGGHVHPFLHSMIVGKKDSTWRIIPVDLSG